MSSHLESPPIDGLSRLVSATLNSGCFCTSLDEAALGHALESELGSPGLSALVREWCPYLFSAQPVFISTDHMARMAQVVGAVESVVALPAFRRAVLADAPPVAHYDAGGAKGVFYGYDFHIDGDSVGLIEINTNAGGAMLNAVLARAQSACCPEMESMIPPLASTRALEQGIVDMFQNEWQRCGRNRPLRSIAIVDESPEQQYLYPEFLLFQQLFRRNGLEAVIAAPSELTLRDGVLWHRNAAIDLVYNRHTDFMLTSPANATLRTAFLDGAVVLTPHPQAHVLYADKRNLALLTDPGRLDALGVTPEIKAILLAGIPHTEIVDPAQADRLWNERRRLFFKPTAGYGSRATYRGDKVTKRVWQDILADDYVAQAIVAPGERVIGHRDSPQILKFDVRVYVYDGAVQWVAARLYQGQTTNFRTPGGGFAPVYSVANESDSVDAHMIQLGNSDLSNEHIG
ncbi:hypothetical protein [Herbaspirillum sp. ST 5-3]|uniref:hypothetical protein n=1 Tax=Oxalobacteraceae TaxID=75682 RepID=UPI0010A3C90B|nr:hypothetical protein [Herbaspirillum sp. ST 5-3]